LQSEQAFQHGNQAIISSLQSEQAFQHCNQAIISSLQSEQAFQHCNQSNQSMSSLEPNCISMAQSSNEWAAEMDPCCH
jgi:hypothetical protein